MRPDKKRSDSNIGSIDGDEGRGVRLDENDEPIIEEDRDAFAVLDEEDDSNPGDRRRDPLRRP